jgi:hypothetical protein
MQRKTQKSSFLETGGLVYETRYLHQICRTDDPIYLDME